jgi:protein-tyrosine kinase
MSKIFSALKKAQGELAAIASPLIDLVEGNGSRTPELESISELHQAPVPGERAQTAPGSPVAVALGAGGRNGSAELDSSPELHRARLEEVPAAPASRVVFEIDRGVAVAEPDSGSELRKARVEKVQVAAASRIVMVTDPGSPAADRFRYLRMRLRELKDSAKLRTLVITSPLPGDGKSTVAANLATALAEGGKRTVLLVEADMHNPTLTKTLGIQTRPGLAECLETGLDPLAALCRLEPLCWYLLQAGEPRMNPTELFQSDALAAVMRKVSPHFDWIVIDSPPAAPLADTLLLSRQSDATLLVVRADRTPQASVKEAVTLLGPKRVLGIVLNGAEGLDRLYSQYSTYYRKKSK